MFKPFFSNPFKSLATRDGIAIGKGSERTMLDSVGDRSGFLKRFLTNADGSTTMLQTRGGMPRFTNSGGLDAGSNGFSISDANVEPYASSTTHTLNYAPQTGLRTFKLWIVPKMGVSSFVVSSLNNGLTISGDTVTVPDGYLWYPVTVTVSFTPFVSDMDGSVAYEIHAGKRRGKNSVFGNAVIRNL
jgi:hypothetical protein